MVSEKGFCLPQHKFPTVIQLTTNKYIILIIWFYIFFQGILWCFSYPVERIWEDLISLTTFIYRHKLTWQVDVQRCKKLHATVWQKLMTVAKGKTKIEMSPFSWLYKFSDFINALGSIFSQKWSLSKTFKTCKLEHLFSEPLANPIFFLKTIILFQGVV